MDDFFVACHEKIQNATDPIAAINELAAISLADLPRILLCKFAEQTVTLLSVISQTNVSSQQDLIAKFRKIRHQLEMTLDFMEKIMEMEKEFPSTQQGGDGCWW